MTEERAQRRLAAILAADVVGYGRLLEQDEAGTLASLKRRRRDILNPLVAEHHGRIVKVMGDGALVEFGSEPTIEFINDGPGKPVAINRFIGRRPILTFGNSDGNQQMLQYTSGGDGPRLMLLVHHTDAEREWAYDRTSSIGKLDKALDEAQAKGWTVVDMKADWKTVFPPEQ